MTGTTTTTRSATGTRATRFNLTRQATIKPMRPRAIKEHARLGNILTLAQGQRFTANEKESDCAQRHTSEFRKHSWEY